MMAWYDKYYETIELNDYFYVGNDKIFPAASKCIHPSGKNTVQWFEYRLEDLKYKRVYKNDKTYKLYSIKQVKAEFPEFFI